MRWPSSGHGGLLPLVVALAVAPGCNARRSSEGGADTIDASAGGADSATTDALAVVDGPVGGDERTAMDGGRPTSTVVAVNLTACPAGDYAAAVTIGGARGFSLVVDTGSTTLGVASEACTDCDGVTPVYEPGPTAVDEDTTASSQFVTGGWSGTIYEDSVQAGTASAKVNLVAIDSQDQFFQTVQCGDGVVGFAPAASALHGTTGFFDQLVANAAFEDVFSIELCPSQGTLWLGGFDPTATSGPVQYVPFSSSPYSSYYYVVGLASVTVQGVTVPVATGAYSDAIVDTGTNAFIVSGAAYGPITSAIARSPAFAQVFGADAGATFFSQPPPADAGASDAGGDIDAGIEAGQGCATVTASRSELDAMLPPLTLTFGSSPGVTVHVTATQSYLTQATDNVWCASIASVTAGPAFPFDAIVGTPILQSSVTVFDRANRRLGFAPHTSCP
jgi:hypothetical protein